MKRILCLLFAFAFLISPVLPHAVSALSQPSDGNVTVLFTHDLHSHLLPSNKPDGGQFGGYARLMYLINQQKQRHPNAILVDGGDFSMGSLFQTAFATSAIELRMMGAMGYDATTFGNHEYDYLPEGLAGMLHAAVASGDPLPAILEGNYLPPTEGETGYNEESQLLWDAFDSYGVKDYMLLERGGVYFAIFGVMGYDSDACAPNSGSVLQDPVATAQKIVDEATRECREQYGVSPVVICLSHSGTSGGKGEDYELAQKVSGIHLIVSGHTHTTLPEPIRVGDTYIASAGEYGKYLGVVNMNQTGDGSVELVDYELIPIDENTPEDSTIAQMVEDYKQTVNQDYLLQYGVDFDMVMILNDVVFDSVKEVYATQHESTLGNLFSDAYKWAAENAGGVSVDVALTAAGVIRETLPLGEVTVSDIFNAASLGVGTEGELIAVYITGKDLKNALEVDASVQPLMRGAQLFFSGVEYSFNTNRMIFNKVDYAMLRREEGKLEEIEDEELYCVVTGMYAGQMLGNVEESSFGLISITPRDAQGNPIDSKDLVNYVIRDMYGRPVKEWYAITIYLGSMYGHMYDQYAQPDGRKVVYESWNPIDLLRNANVFTYAVLAAGLLVVGVVTLVSVQIVKKVKKRKV